MYGLKHSLSLVRKTYDDSMFRGATAGAGKVSPDKILWFIPQVIPADAEKFSIYKTIESKVKLPIAYRTRQCHMLSVPESTSFTLRLSIKTASKKPRFIIVGFRMDKDGNQTRNSSTFDYVNLKNSYVTLNSDRYPRLIITCRSPARNIIGCMVMQPCSRVKFFGMDELIIKSNITSSDYKTLYSLFTFDDSKQKEKLKSSAVDIQIKANLLKMFLPTRHHLHWLFQTRCCYFILTVSKCL